MFGITWKAFGGQRDGMAGSLFGTGPQEMEQWVKARLTTWGHVARPSRMPQDGSSPRAVFLGPACGEPSDLTLLSHQH